MILSSQVWKSDILRIKNVRRTIPHNLPSSYSYPSKKNRRQIKSEMSHPSWTQKKETSKEKKEGREKEREEKEETPTSFSIAHPAEVFLSRIPHPAPLFTIIPHPAKHPVKFHANEATRTQFIRGRRSNMASLNYRHIGRLLHRLHLCRGYNAHFSVSVFFNSQSNVILVSLCSFFVPKAAVCS